MKKFNPNNFLRISGIMLGGIVGYYYWKEIGCSTGTCPITAKPLNSILYFSILGFIFTGLLTKEKSNND